MDQKGERDFPPDDLIWQAWGQARAPQNLLGRCCALSLALGLGLSLPTQAGDAPAEAKAQAPSSSAAPTLAAPTPAAPAPNPTPTQIQTPTSAQTSTSTQIPPAQAALRAEPPRGRSFAQALQIIVERDLGVKIEQNSWESAKWKYQGARVNFLPRLSVSASQDVSGDPNTRSKSYGYTASINLFRGGADLANLRATELASLAGEQKVSSAQLAAEQTAAEALIEYIQKARVVSIRKREVANQKHYLEIAEERFNKSVFSRQEVDKVTLDLSTSEANLSDAENDFSEATAKLRQWLGDEQVQTSWPWLDSFDKTWVQQLLSKQNELTSRPDFRAGLLTLESQTQFTKKARRSIWPAIDLSFSQSQSLPDGGPAPGWSSTITLTMPLFNGLQDYTNYRSSVTEQYSAEARLRQLERDIEAQQFLAKDRFKRSLQDALRRDEALRIAQRMVDVTSRRFQAGRADANEVSIDQSRAINAELSSVTGWKSAHLALSRLLQAYGLSINNI